MEEPEHIVIDETPTASGTDFDASAERGHRIVLGIFATWILVSVGWIVFLLLYVGPDRLPMQIGRTALAVYLLFNLVEGHGWARTLCVVLLVAGILLGLFTIGDLFDRDVLVGSVLAGIPVVDGVIAFLLTANTDVDRFFRRVRR